MAWRGSSIGRVGGCTARIKRLPKWKPCCSKCVEAILTGERVESPSSLPARCRASTLGVVGISLPGSGRGHRPHQPAPAPGDLETLGAGLRDGALAAGRRAWLPTGGRHPRHPNCQAGDGSTLRCRSRFSRAMSSGHRSAGCCTRTCKRPMPSAGLDFAPGWWALSFIRWEPARRVPAGACVKCSV